MFSFWSVHCASFVSRQIEITVQEFIEFGKTNNNNKNIYITHNYEDRMNNKQNLPNVSKERTTVAFPQIYERIRVGTTVP